MSVAGCPRPPERQEATGSCDSGADSAGRAPGRCELLGTPLTRTPAPGAQRHPSLSSHPTYACRRDFFLCAPETQWEKDGTAAVTNTLPSGTAGPILSPRTHWPRHAGSRAGRGEQRESLPLGPARPPCLRGARGGRCHAPRPGRHTSQGFSSMRHRQRTATRSLARTSSNWKGSPAPSRQLLPSVLGPGPRGPVSTDQKVQFTADVAKIRPHGNV